MQLKMALCDDEAVTREALSRLVSAYAEQNSLTLQLQQFASGEELLKNMEPDTNIVLLDIRMNGITGMNAARVLRERSSEALIIFITSMTQYALEGYEVHAFGFLRKPVRAQQLTWLLDDAMDHLKAHQAEPLLFAKHSGIVLLEVGQILYFETTGHETTVSMADGKQYSGSTPLGELEGQLTSRGFFRLHKGYLINLSQVVEISQTSVRMKNGQEIPLSKHRRKDFLAALGRGGT